MIGAEIKLNNLPQLFAKLKAPTKEDVLKKTLRDVALNLVRWVKKERLSGRVTEPSGDTPGEGLNVQTGNLRASITKSRVEVKGSLFSGKEYEVRIGTNIEYAPKHELGLNGFPQRRFLQPALEDIENQRFALDELTRRINIGLNLEKLGL